MSDMSFIDRTIFDKSEELTYGAVNISSTFAVPSHSVLQIHSNIKVNDDNVAAILKFEPYGKPGLAFQDKIFREKSCIRVFVEFAPAKSVLLEYPISEWKGLKTFERGFDENIIEFFEDQYVNLMIEMPTFTRPTNKFLKKDRLIYIQPHLEHLREMEWNTYSDSYDRDALMEIFSVSVHPICGDCDSFRLKGIIKATDGSRNTVLFDGDKLPVDLFPNENVRLKGPRSCYRGEYFGIYCDLKDDEGREISSGYATYDLSTISSWYNRRICSVVKGIWFCNFALHNFQRCCTS
ncbi:uncharacterized protein LOC110705179 [Chenopodium quinoa]|uniref:uncharacterized protein LOC110705179 n=1 Tax=Chenopodium quinoa TaxID=63459 RepID=UPI000B76D351|nr:uncharacterized protein LOC110705179 [Chenopodium quinoa]